MLLRPIGFTYRSCSVLQTMHTLSKRIGDWQKPAGQYLRRPRETTETVDTSGLSPVSSETALMSAERGAPELYFTDSSSSVYICIGLSRYIAITTFLNIAVIAAFCRISPSILNRFKPNLQAYMFLAYHKTRLRAFLSFLAQAVSEHGAAATFFWSCCASHGVVNPSTASH